MALNFSNFLGAPLVIPMCTCPGDAQNWWIQSPESWLPRFLLFLLLLRLLLLLLLALLPPSAQKLLQTKIWGVFAAFAFVMERQIKAPRVFFRICFCNDHVGHAQATITGHTYEDHHQNPRDFLSLSRGLQNI